MIPPRTRHFYLLILILLILAATATAGALKTVIVTVTAPLTSPSSPSYISPSEFKNAILSSSNTYRSRHDAGPLVWNERLVAYASNWGKGCLWKHSNGPYGENLAYGYPNATAAVAAWADEVKKYTFHPPSGFTEATGHFTQLVWNSTTEVGCAAVDCGYDQTVAVVAGEKRAKGWYVVCEYRPAGNVVGRDNALFKSNVFPRVAEESLTSALHSRSGHASGTGMATGNPGERKVSSGAAAGRGRAGILGVVAFVLLWL